jgi:hypothetical protein
LSPYNRKFTWGNNENNLVLDKLDRNFISTEWDQTCPLVKVSGLAKGISDHSPLLIDSGENCFFVRRNSGFRNGGCRGQILRMLLGKHGHIATLIHPLWIDGSAK